MSISRREEVLTGGRRSIGSDEVLSELRVETLIGACKSKAGELDLE